MFSFYRDSRHKQDSPHNPLCVVHSPYVAQFLIDRAKCERPIDISETIDNSDKWACDYVLMDIHLNGKSFWDIDLEITGEVYAADPETLLQALCSGYLRNDPQINPVISKGRLITRFYYDSDSSIIFEITVLAVTREEAVEMARQEMMGYFLGLASQLV